MLETSPIIPILLFPQNEPIILSKLPIIIPVLFPAFAFHRPQNIETELHAQR